MIAALNEGHRGEVSHLLSTHSIDQLAQVKIKDPSLVTCTISLWAIGENRISDFLFVTSVLISPKTNIEFRGERDETMSATTSNLRDQRPICLLFFFLSCTTTSKHFFVSQ